MELEHDEAFLSAKTALQADTLLVHFDPAKPLLLACDASQYGVGAVLSHITDDGQERPVANASHTLNAAERDYSQLEKEGIAVVFGVKKFHCAVISRSSQTINPCPTFSMNLEEHHSWHLLAFSDGH